jgi:hypothetical protein
MNTKHSSLDNWENDIDMTYQMLQQKLTSKERNEQQPSLNSCKSENNWSDSDNVIISINVLNALKAQLSSLHDMNKRQAMQNQLLKSELDVLRDTNVTLSKQRDTQERASQASIESLVSKLQMSSIDGQKREIQLVKTFEDKLAELELSNHKLSIENKTLISMLKSTQIKHEQRSKHLQNALMQSLKGLGSVEKTAIEICHEKKRLYNICHILATKYTKNKSLLDSLSQ